MEREECPYACKAREEILRVRNDIKELGEYAENNSFKPWMRALVITLFGTLFLVVYSVQSTMNKEYIPRNEAREDMAEIRQELVRLNNKIDQLIQARTR